MRCNIYLLFPNTLKAERRHFLALLSFYCLVAPPKALVKHWSLELCCDFVSVQNK